VAPCLTANQSPWTRRNKARTILGGLELRRYVADSREAQPVRYSTLRASTMCFHDVHCSTGRIAGQTRGEPGVSMPGPIPMSLKNG